MFRPTQVPGLRLLRISPTGLSPPAVLLSRSFGYPGLRFLRPVLLPRGVRELPGLGSSPFDRLYWGNRCYFLFLRVLRCFSSPRSPRLIAGVGIAPDGLPHSDIRGSLCMCHSPRLFAACHVLLRLREPRHPPCALSCSVIFFVGLSYHAFCFVVRETHPRSHTLSMLPRNRS